MQNNVNIPIINELYSLKLYVDFHVIWILSQLKKNPPKVFRTLFLGTPIQATNHSLPSLTQNNKKTLGSDISLN